MGENVNEMMSVDDGIGSDLEIEVCVGLTNDCEELGDDSEAVDASGDVRLPDDDNSEDGYDSGE
jgi:hypothetical protein